MADRQFDYKTIPAPATESASTVEERLNEHAGDGWVLDEVLTHNGHHDSLILRRSVDE